ncbi:hypothetical protein FD37_GL000917 [Levilactobacillus spicheri DSM 15429]|nr:hypothetical protein FD37_GL000917 [Levilactobacillus spicheri DSM 15429]
MWNKLLYYALSSVTDYLCEDNLAVNQHFRSQLEFAGKFFETLPQINLDVNKLFGDEELILFSATAYVFAGYPGASAVVLKGLTGDKLSSTERVLAEVIRYGDVNFPWENSKIGLTTSLVFSGREDISILYKQVDSLLEDAYRRDHDIDIIAAECVQKIIRQCWENATINLMPSFSDTDPQKWVLPLTARKVHPVLWSAQRELGKHNVFRGNSAVVQLPTGSGKTASFSLILRASLYRDSFHIAVIVAPFKSIRDEIYLDLKLQFHDEEVDINRISTELKFDFSDFSLIERPAILIVTPEKLLFMIRYDPNFLSETGLFIFDEAHQLDNSDRGITFELLLSTINFFVTDEIQKIFVSAVIGNPNEVSEWFNSGNNNVVNKLTPRKLEKVLGYSYWNDKTMHGELYIWNKLQEAKALVKFPYFFDPVKIKENKIQPDFTIKNRTKGIRWATALTTRQFMKGGMVAVYVPRKDTIKGLAQVFMELQEKSPILIDGNESVVALCKLFELNFGEDSVLVRAYRNGIFVHDGDIPDGIRGSLEFEARNGNIPLLLCTNTLAQGVNLPIKTIIITSIGNGEMELNNRDTINLIGRVGRTGVINEGNIIFMQNISSFSDERVKHALNSLAIDAPAEPLGSSLAALFMPTAINSYSRSEDIRASEWCVPEFLDNPMEWISNRVKGDSPSKAKAYRRLFLKKANGIWQIENYLMSIWNVIQEGVQEENIENVVKKMFASTCIRDDEFDLMLWTFKYLGERISRLVVDRHDVLTMSKMMVGINEALTIKSFVDSNDEVIITSDDMEQIITDIWPILRTSVSIKNQSEDSLYRFLLNKWIKGSSYIEILESWKLEYPDIRLSNRKPTVEKVYIICSQAFQFDMQLKLTALMEVITDPVKYARLEKLQVAMKLGLPKKTEQVMYGAGISDRVLARLFCEEMGVDTADYKEVLHWLRMNKGKIIEKFGNIIPEYFRSRIW